MLLASAALIVPVVSAPVASAQPAVKVSMTVDRITPWTPTPTHNPSPITFQLTIVSNENLPEVRIFGERGDPIQSQAAMDAAIAKPAPPATGGLPIQANPEVKVLQVKANTPTPVTFSTTTSLQDDGRICLCSAGDVYPLFFSAHVTGPGGVDQRLGVVATYLPVFDGMPKPLQQQVSWLWPLLDRPHRLAGNTIFTDDDLATEIAPAGRLGRALQVVQDVGDSIPLTLVVDPELLDEIWVMANKPYQVRNDAQLVTGIGKDAATAWLTQLRDVLTSDPNVQVELTPFADPNVQALSAAGRSWLNALPTTMAADVSDALAGRTLDATLAWPAKGAISRSTLATLERNGVSTVVLSSSAVTPTLRKGAVPQGLARLRAGGTDIAAALTSPTLERDVTRALNPPDRTSSALPQLLAELAIRTAQEPDLRHPVVLTPPRYVDATVDSAVEMIRETSRSTFAQPIALREAVSPNAGLLPVGRSGLAAVRSSADAVSNPTFDAATNASIDLPAIRSLLDTKNDLAAHAFVQSLPIAIQRAESSAWIDPTQAGAAGSYAGDLNNSVDDVMDGVRIVPPSSGLYTLGSSGADLPITVDNELPYAVKIRISINSVPTHLPGFSVKDIGIRSVDSKQKLTLKIPTTMPPTARIKIVAVLFPPNKAKQLGAAQGLTVRNTELGVIGVIITITAGVVLVLALLVRFARRMRKRGTKAAAPPPVQVDEPEPAT